MYHEYAEGRRGFDRMVVEFMQSVPITTNVVSSNSARSCDVHSIQHYSMTVCQ